MIIASIPPARPAPRPAQPQPQPREPLGRSTRQQVRAQFYRHAWDQLRSLDGTAVLWADGTFAPRAERRRRMRLEARTVWRKVSLGA